MADQCVWIIKLGEVEQLAQLVAAGLMGYGLQVKGQKWPTEEPQAWLPSAQEAATGDAGLVVLVADPSLFANPNLRRSLALFRLSLQTRKNRKIDGFVFFQGEMPDLKDSASYCHRVLEDWLTVDPKTNWLAKAVARLHVPTQDKLPIAIGLHAHERLGVWLEVRRNPAAESNGCFAGVSGQDVKIDFHAVGPKGRLPSRTVNEYELQGIKFDYMGLCFDAWGLQNALSPDHSYYVRLEGEPVYIAAGELPNGEIMGVDLVCLG